MVWEVYPERGALTKLIERLNRELREREQAIRDLQAARDALADRVTALGG